MQREIVVYPDKRLKMISKEVELFDQELHQLLDDMYDSMIAKNGIGLAAIQIGVPQRVLIINIPLEDSGDGDSYGKDRQPNDQPRSNTIEMINPVITQSSGQEKFQEGCLSVPGFYEDVTRAKSVTVEYFDRNGNAKSISDENFLAIAIQHEMDHLNGRVFVEKLSYTKRKKFEKEWRRKEKGA
jgi:peptide deformylase